MMNSPARLDIEISTPSRMNRTQEYSRIWTASRSKPRPWAALRNRATVPWWSSPQM